MFSLATIVALFITAICSFVEAIIQYNLNHRNDDPNNNAFCLFPKISEMCRILLIAIFFAIVSSMLSEFIINRYIK